MLSALIQCTGYTRNSVLSDLVQEFIEKALNLYGNPIHVNQEMMLYFDRKIIHDIQHGGFKYLFYLQGLPTECFILNLCRHQIQTIFLLG